MDKTIEIIDVLASPIDARRGAGQPDATTSRDSGRSEATTSTVDQFQQESISVEDVGVPANASAPRPAVRFKATTTEKPARPGPTDADDDHGVAELVDTDATEVVVETGPPAKRFKFGRWRPLMMVVMLSC